MQRSSIVAKAYIVSRHIGGIVTYLLTVAET